jgi:hypothetical protein
MDGDSEGVVWGDSPYLTVSFAPDGTNVAGQASQLFSSLNRITSEANWQQSIVSALQTWVIHVNGDIAKVTDNGDPFGAEGLSQGDARFGDIRVAAIPMRRNVYGLAISRGFVSGTWAGDILLNSNRIAQNRPLDIDTLDEVYRVALHEAGHVFGLEDNGNPNSPMNSHGIPDVVIPAPEDLLALQNRFGVRAPDLNDLDQNNDTIDEATQLDSSDDFTGTYPHFIFGDLGLGDRDVFELNPLDNATGPVTFKVRTDGLSSLRPQLSIQNRFGVPLAEAQSTSSSGDTISVTIPSINPEEKYYAVVSGVAGDIHAIGGYSLVVTYDQSLQTTPDAIRRFSGPEFRFLDQDDIEEFFLDDDDGEIDDVNDDLGMDDNPTVATVLAPTPGYAENTRYSMEASLASATDIDFYRVRAPIFVGSQPRVMTVLVRGALGSVLSPSIQVLDSNAVPLDVVPLVRHGNETVLQVMEMVSDANYFIRIQDPTATGNGTSNYKLTVLFGTAPQDTTIVSSRVLTSSFQEHTVSFPRAVLVSPSIWGSDQNNLLGSWTVSIFNSQNQLVSSFSGSATEFRSAPSMYLGAGDYRFRITSTGAVPSSQNPLAYQLRLAVVTDPLSVPLVRGTRRTVKRIDRVDNDFVFPGVRNPRIEPPTNSGRSLNERSVNTVDSTFAAWNNSTDIV